MVGTAYRKTKSAVIIPSKAPQGTCTLAAPVRAQFTPLPITFLLLHKVEVQPRKQCRQRMKVTTHCISKQCGNEIVHEVGIMPTTVVRSLDAIDDRSILYGLLTNTEFICNTRTSFCWAVCTTIGYRNVRGVMAVATKITRFYSNQLFLGIHGGS